jgi:hypothetical protein
VKNAFLWFNVGYFIQGDETQYKLFAYIDSCWQGWGARKKSEQPE